MSPWDLVSWAIAGFLTTLFVGTSIAIVIGLGYAGWTAYKEWKNNG